MKKSNFTPLFIILCLGYLIDYYDLSLFAVARISILKDLQIPEPQYMSVSKLLFNAQALGIFAGGILSGIWGDKIGRVSTIRAGIFLYSAAIIINIFIKSIPLFAFFRFVAGVGLAGELAASVTLLSEIVNKENRVIVSSVVYCFGVLGGILTTAIGSLYDWKVLFLIGGIAGFILLFLRKFLVDSIIFLNLKQKNNVPRGSLKLLLTRPKSILKVLKLTICLIPFWLMVFFVNFSPEIARGIGITEKINLPYCLFLFFIGSLFGVFAFSYLEKFIKNHKKTILIGFLLILISILLQCFVGKFSAAIFTYLFLLVGFSTGYLGNYMILLTENFGTNQRSTGTTFTSCLGRSSLIFVNSLVPFFIQFTQSTASGLIVSGVLIIFISAICLFFTRETIGISMDYTE